MSLSFIHFIYDYRTRKSTTKPHPTLNRESAASQIRSQPLAEKASSQAAVSTTSSLLATNKLMADRAIEQQVMDVLAAKELINLGQSSHHQHSSSYELPPASPPSQNQDEGLPIYSFSSINLKEFIYIYIQQCCKSVIYY